MPKVHCMTVVSYPTESQFLGNTILIQAHVNADEFYYIAEHLDVFVGTGTTIGVPVNGSGNTWLSGEHLSDQAGHGHDVGPWTPPAAIVAAAHGDEVTA